MLFEESQGSPEGLDYGFHRETWIAAPALDLIQGSPQ